MDKEKVLRWLGSDVDFHVTKVLKQHWYKQKYSYLNTPRPDFGLMLLVSGSIDFITEHGTISARTGNLVFLSKHSRYEAVFSDEVDDYLICFDADEEGGLPFAPMILSECTNLACFDIIRVLSDENIYGTRTQLYNKGRFLLLLDSILESIEDESDAHSYIVKHACDLLQKNEKLTIEQIAKKCAISTSLLRRIFTEKLGVSPVKYRMDMKLRRAMYLIESTNMTVSEIAEYLSFFDAAYFCKLFRAHTGMTPTQYAKSKRI